MASKASLTVIQMNDSHAYFDLHQETFWQGGQAIYRPVGGYARVASALTPTSRSRILLDTVSKNFLLGMRM